MESNRIQIASSQSILELFITLISCGSAMKALGGFINIIGFVGTVFERKKNKQIHLLNHIGSTLHCPIHLHVH